MSQNAVYVWRRAWLAEGESGLASKGPSGNDCRLTPAQVDKLAGLLQEGPAAHGWVEDQRWALARVTDLIASRFRARYTLKVYQPSVVSGPIIPSRVSDAPTIVSGRFKYSHRRAVPTPVSPLNPTRSQ